MMDAMGVWDSICCSPWFRNTSLVRISRASRRGKANMHSIMALIHSHAPTQILFLNKEDLFRDRIQYSHIRDFFPVRPQRWVLGCNCALVLYCTVLTLSSSSSFFVIRCG